MTKCPYCGYTKDYARTEDPAFYMDCSYPRWLVQQDASGSSATLCACPKCRKVFIES